MKNVAKQIFGIPIVFLVFFCSLNNTMAATEWPVKTGEKLSYSTIEWEVDEIIIEGVISIKIEEITSTRLTYSQSGDFSIDVYNSSSLYDSESIKVSEKSGYFYSDSAFSTYLSSLNETVTAMIDLYEFANINPEIQYTILNYGFEISMYDQTSNTTIYTKEEFSDEGIVLYKEYYANSGNGKTGYILEKVNNKIPSFQIEFISSFSLITFGIILYLTKKKR